MTCSYAACDLPPTRILDGWAFCKEHATLHREEAVGYERDTSPRCGTVAGHRTHIDAGTTPCSPCRKAQSSAEWYQSRRNRAPCGTSAGYERHRRNHERACDPCREANAARKRGAA